VGRENIAITKACQKQNRVPARGAAARKKGPKNPENIAIFASRPTVKVTMTRGPNPNDEIRMTKECSNDSSPKEILFH
jgi:hypothetical protein